MSSLSTPFARPPAPARAFLGFSTLALALGLAALAAPARGQAPEAAPASAPLRLSLAEAVRLALDEGTAARIAATRTDEAAARALEARSALLPQLSFGGLASSQSLNLATFGFPSAPGESPVVGPFNVVDAHLTLAMNVIDVAARRRYEAARAGIQVSEVDRRRTENEVAAAVAALYIAIGRASARIDTIGANVSLFEKLRDLALDQKKAGVGTRLDTTRAEFQLARQHQALLVANNQRDIARLALLRAIGADLGTEVVLTDDWRATVPAPELGAVLSAALRDRPEIALSDERLRAAGLLVKAAEAEKLPTLGFQAQAVENGNRAQDLYWNRTLGAAVTIPLFTGKRTEAHIAEARSQRERLQIERRDTERQIEQEVRQALLAWRNARSRVELADQSVRLADEELEQASDRFKAGVAPSIEIDNAQTSVASARDTRIDAQADEAQARFDLARATGQIRALIPGSESGAAGADSGSIPSKPLLSNPIPANQKPSQDGGKGQ